MLKIVYYLTLPIFISITFFNSNATSENIQDMIDNPHRYIVISDWSFYDASRVGILTHVEIENKSSIRYKDLRVRVNYFAGTPHLYGNQVSQQVTTLKITLEPHSKKVYLKSGQPIGMGAQDFLAKSIILLSATGIRN